MRLLSARGRHYLLHRDLAVAFDPNVTVIASPNQSGKSTVAEACGVARQRNSLSS